MSYHAPNTGDPELDRQLAHEDFVMLLPRLQAADTDLGFAVWLDKLALIERDAIIAYLREHWDTLNRTQRMIARVHLHELRSEPVD